MAIKIVLDANALEALIGDNEEVRLSLTQAAVQELCRRKVKPLCDDSVKDALEKASLVVGREVTNALSEYFKFDRSKGYGGSWKMRPEQLKVLREKVHSIMHDYYNDTLVEIFEEQRALIKERIIRTLGDNFTEGVIKKEAQKIARAIAEEHIKNLTAI